MVFDVRSVVVDDKQWGAMSAGENQSLPGKGRILPTRFRLAGVSVLVAGLLVAVMIARRAADEGGSDADALGDSKRYDYAMERIGGKSNAVASEFREWFDSLWHGRKLARTVVVLSVGGSIGCFILAHLLTDPSQPDDPGRGPDTRGGCD